MYAKSGLFISFSYNTNIVKCKTLTVEKSDKYDELILNHQNFSHQNFTLRKLQYCIFNGYKLLT